MELQRTENKLEWYIAQDADSVRVFGDIRTLADTVVVDVQNRAQQFSDRVQQFSVDIQGRVDALLARGQPPEEEIEFPQDDQAESVSQF